MGNGGKKEVETKRNGGQESEDGVVTHRRGESCMCESESGSFLSSLKIFSVFNTQLCYNHGKTRCCVLDLTW